MITILGLDHVQLAMPQGGEGRARAFYTGILGMAEVAKPPQLAARGGCWFQGGGAQIHLGVAEPFAPARKAHPALLVADLAAAHTELEAAGIAVTPDESVPGVRRCYVADPFGNRIELIQDGEGFGQAHAVRSRASVFVAERSAPTPSLSGRAARASKAPSGPR